MKSKKILGILTAFVTATCCMGTVVSEENNEVSVLMTSSAASVYDEYLDWSQLDSRWSNTPMGSTTIRKSGCLITALAIMAVHSDSIDSAAMKNLGITDIEQFNPGVLANAYTSVGGFSWGGAISSWGTIHNLIPNITWGKDAYLKNTSKSDAAKELKSLMDDDWHIIARVNNGGSHWVYIESVDEDGSITMCDPALDTHDLYEGYPNGLQGEYWAIKGKNPPSCTAEQYEGKLNIEITALPEVTEYELGKKLDLTGGMITLSGVDPRKGSWTGEPVSMESVENITIDTSAYDPDTLGVYDIVVNADMGYASAEITFPVSVCCSLGEYFVKEDVSAEIYNEEGKVAMQLPLKKGNVVNIIKSNVEYGFIESEDISGWINTSLLEKAEVHVHETGDINNDGVVDKYDLSLLNFYLQQNELLLDGVSTLTSSQLKAADLNDDGNVDLADVREYLLMI